MTDQVDEREALHAEIEALRAENMRLCDKYNRDVYGLNNEGDPIGGDPAGGYANDNARLRARLRAELESARGLWREMYPCKPDIFIATYEPEVQAAQHMQSAPDSFEEGECEVVYMMRRTDETAWYVTTFQTFEHIAAGKSPQHEAVKLYTAATAQPAARQYYYKVDGCRASVANDEDCICWHDEGTGPHPKAGNEFSWRDKPAACDRGEVQRLRDGEAVEVVAHVATMGFGQHYASGIGEPIDRCIPGEPLMTVAQHQRISAAMTAEVERLQELCECNTAIMRAQDEALSRVNKERTELHAECERLRSERDAFRDSRNYLIEEISSHLSEIAELREALRDTARWIERLPVQAQGAIRQLERIDAALAGSTGQEQGQKDTDHEL